MRWFLLLVGCFALVLSASAEVPQQLHYNGYLTNAIGEAVDCPDPFQCEASYDFVFRLYTSSAGGSPIWEETYPGMALFGGSFNVVLGTITPINADLLDGPTWLSLSINDNPEMSPRQKITSAAYALKAERSEQATEADNATKLGGIEATDYATQDTVNAIQSSLSPVATQGLPPDLIDGDNDTLGELICSAGMVPKMTNLGWACGADDSGGDDTTLSEEEVDAFVADNGYALISEIFSGDYNDLSNVPADANTQLTEEEVDALVANNGYAAQADLDATQLALTELQTSVNDLESATNAEIATLQANIDAVEAALLSADSNLQSQISVLQAQVAALETAGLTVTEDAEACSTIKTGALRYHEDIVEICNGTVWVAIYTPPAPQPDGSSAVNAGVNCQGILGAGLSSGSGFYWIDPDNDADISNAFKVHCDMSNSGGGWTLVATLSNVDGVRSWSHTSPQFSAWLDNTSLVGATPLLNSDYKSRAYGELDGTQLMIMTNKGVTGTWSGVNGTLLARISAEASNCVTAPPDSERILPNLSASHGSLARDIWLAAADGNSPGSCALSNQADPSDSAVLTFADTQNYGVGNGSGWQGIGQSWEQNIKNTREPAVTCDTATDCLEDFVSAYGWEAPGNDEAFIHTVFNDGNEALEPDLILLYVR